MFRPVEAAGRSWASPLMAICPTALYKDPAMTVDRRTFAMSLLFGAASALQPFKARSQSQPALQTANNVVLVHGLFADGSSWSEVIPLLQARGLGGLTIGIV